jgi:hypothetical protein
MNLHIGVANSDSPGKKNRLTSAGCIPGACYPASTAIVFAGKQFYKNPALSRVFAGKIINGWNRGMSVGYVQDVRYIAKEHMDVRRDPYNVAHRLQKTVNRTRA